MSISSSSTIYIGNLPPQLDESSLAAYFTPFGDIVSISVPSTETVSGKRNKGFGFITFSSGDDALDALDNMNLNAISGRTIRVNLADPTKLKDGAKPNSARAVWDNEEWLKQYAANEQDVSTPSEPNAEQSDQAQTSS